MANNLLAWYLSSQKQKKDLYKAMCWISKFKPNWMIKISSRYVINTKTLNIFMTNNIKIIYIYIYIYNILYLGNIIDDCQGVYLLVDLYV